MASKLATTPSGETSARLLSPNTMEDARPSVDVVVVSYHCRELLRQCLLSIREHQPSLPVRVFVVDNGSTDGTVEMLRSQFEWVEVEASKDNLGFSQANNRAIRRGTGRYVLALNPDTRFVDDGLEKLVRLMDARPEIGICGCRLVLESGALDHAAKRAFPTPLGALAHFTGIGRRRDAPPQLAQYRAPEVESGVVDAVNGAFMLMRRSALEEVGLFDEGFWMYMEDLDLCYRFKRAGWIVWYEPSVTVVHAKAGTSGKYRKARINYAFHYGMFRFYRKHYSSEHSRAMNTVVYGGIASKLAVSLTRAAVNRRIQSLRRRRQRRFARV
jgi:N-acetylglucosaminyl-diphospho-decaprenol L-rhamnosyltransferase